MKFVNKQPVRTFLIWVLTASGIGLVAVTTPGLVTIPDASAAGAGTIRQEINLLDSNYTGTNTALNSDEFSQLDPTKYSGTVSYYFEVVGTASSSSSGSIDLRRKGTTTDDATISTSNLGTSSTRYRSAAFTTPGSATEYFVHADAAGSSKTVTLKAARIIIIQTSSPMTSTQTQLEIGSHELAQNNSSELPLPYPKYWTYKASAWDNSPSFYAEVSYKTSSTTTSVWLQEDDSQFGNWTDKVLIAQANTSGSRTRTAFTPVDGKHYRLSTQIVSGAGTYDIYSAKIVVDQTGTTMDPISKLQPQYLLMNGLDSGTTGSQGYQTLYDSSEWSGTVKYKSVMDSGSPFNSVKLSDISNGGADVANSSLSGSYQQFGPLPQYVQGNGDFTGGNGGTTQSTTLPSNVTAGDMIVVVTGAVSSTYNPSVSDNQGNTYSLATTAASATIPYKTAVFYTIASATGPLTVTHTSTTLQFRRVAALEYKDIDSFDASSGNIGPTGAADSGSFVTSYDDELIFGWGISDSGITTTSFGWTARQVIGSEMTQDKIVASAGTYSADFPNTNSPWAAIGAGFYKASGFSINPTDGHQIDSNVINSSGYIAATRIIADVSLPTSVVSVSVSDGNISYGLLGAGSNKDTTSGGLNDTQTATNDGTVAEDFNIKGQDSANWTLAGTAGANQYKHEYCTSGSGTPDPCDAAPTWSALTTSYQSLGTNVPASSTKKFDLRLGMPTSTSTYAQQSVDVTIQAVQH